MWFEDVEQDALLHLHCHLQDCKADSEGALFAWALMVARRAALDAVRTAFEQLSVRSPTILERLADDTPLGDEGEAPSAARRVVDAQRFLSMRDQELLWRRLVRHETWVEVGASLGLSWTAARRRFQRAQSVLRAKSCP